MLFDDGIIHLARRVYKLWQLAGQFGTFLELWDTFSNHGGCWRGRN